MADFDYSQDGAALGDYMKDTLSPLAAAGVDPDEARANQATALASIDGYGSDQPAASTSPSSPAASPTLLAENDTPPAPQDTGRSPNGNILPPGLLSRTSPPPTNPAATAQVAPVAPSASAAGATGGAGDPPVTASGAPPPQLTWADYARRGMANLDTNSTKANDAIDKLQSQPSLQATVQPLEDKLGAPSMQPLNPRQGAYDPSKPQGPGNMPAQENYRPSIGSRVLRGIEGFASGVQQGGVLGGAVGAIDPKRTTGVAYGDPNSQFQRDTTNQNWNKQRINDQIAQAATDYNAETNRGKTLATEFRSNATQGKDEASAATAQQNAETALQREQNNTPEAKAKESELLSNDQFNQRKLRLADNTSPLSKLSPASQAVFLATGRVPDPRQATEGEIALGQATRAWQQSNPGKKPNLDDMRSIMAASKGLAAPGTGAAGDPSAPISPAAQEVIDGRTALPPASSRAPGAQQLRSEVFAHAPQYDETEYPNYKKTRESFTTGKQGDAVRAINQLDGHLKSASTHVPDQSSLSPFNALENAGRDMTGTSRTNQFDVDVNGITGEWGKLVTGGVATKEEASRVAQLLNHNQSPEKIRENLGEVRELMNTAKQRLREQWESGMPPGAVSPLSTLGTSGSPAAGGARTGGSAAGGSGGFSFEQFPEAN